MATNSYLIATGTPDYSRAASLNLIFDPVACFPHDKLKSGDKVLFPACGNGMLVVDTVKSFKERTITVVAFDRSAAQIECAKAYAEQQGVTGIEWRTHDIHDLSKFAGYNIIYARFILNHLEKAKEVVDALCCSLASEGILVSEELGGYHVKLSVANPVDEGTKKLWQAAVKAFEQGVILQHALQKSDIGIGKKVASFFAQNNMAVLLDQPLEVTAKTPEQKHLFVACMQNAPLILSPLFLECVPKIETILTEMRDRNDVELSFTHHQVIVQKP